MTEEQIIRKIIDTLQRSVESFDKQLPGVQDAIADEVALLMKDLQVVNGNLKMSVENLKRISAFRSKVEGIIRKSGYPEAVRDFIKAFDEVGTLHNQYFTRVSSDFKPGKLLGEIKKQAIDSTLESLTGAGLTAELTQPITDILNTNATTGASYSQTLNQLREFITKTNTPGALQKHAKQITTDSLNQFSAQYSNAVTADLGLEWYMYTGPLVESSRDFCEACVKKKYIHKSEIPDLLKGDFPEFKAERGRIDDKTGLPSGMMPGTNPENFHVYRGGYNCRHQLIPVSSAVVPDEIRRRFENAKKQMVSDEEIDTISQNRIYKQDLNAFEVAKVRRTANENISGQKEFGLTDNESRVIFGYTKESYDILNAELYTPKPSEETVAFHKALNNAITKFPDYKNVVLREYQHPHMTLSEYLNDMKSRVGTVIKNEAFWSASRDLEPQYPDVAYLYIRSRTGKPIETMSAYTSEQEVLFGTGKSFYVIKVDGSDVYLEELGD